MKPLGVAILAIIAIVMLAFMAHEVLGHKAPSGWEYPEKCCSMERCHPVTNDKAFSAAQQADGTWVITFTWQGQVVKDRLYPGAVHESGDSEWHICPYKTYSRGHFPNYATCMFIPMTT